MVNKAMEKKTNKSVERKGKKEQICKVKQRQMKIYISKINSKGKRTVGKANKGVNVEKYNSFLKIKIIKKRGEKKKKRKTPQNCKSPMQRQRFITTIKNVTEKEKSSKA